MLNAQVRAFAASAHATLLAAGASSSEPPPPPVDTTELRKTAYADLLSLLPGHLVIPSPNTPSATPMPFHPLLTSSLEFISHMIAALLQAKQFRDAKKWERCVGDFLDPWLHHGGGDRAAGRELAEKARIHFWEADKVSQSSWLSS